MTWPAGTLSTDQVDNDLDNPQQFRATLKTAVDQINAMRDAAPSETNKAALELATQAEADAGTDDQRAMTPAKVASRSVTANQAEAGLADTGTVKQLLGWLAGRVIAITGKANWKTAPATTLELAATHIAATGAHNATSAATASRMVLRDAAGRSKFAASAAPGDVVVHEQIQGIAKFSSAQSAAAASATSIIPNDTTLPTSTEGVEIVSLAHTPAATGNKLHIRAEVPCAASAAATAIATIVRDGQSFADAVGATFISGANAFGKVLVDYDLTAPSTDAITFRLRFGRGALADGTVYINGLNGSTAWFNGAMAARITVTETKV